MRVPSVKRLWTPARDPDEVIDLTDPNPGGEPTVSDDAAAAVQAPAGEPVEQAEPEPPVSADLGEPGAGSPASPVLVEPDDSAASGEAETPVLDEAVAGGDGSDAVGEASHPRLHRVLSFLLLTRASAGSLPPLASIAVALTWLFGVVALVTVVVTAAVGATGDQPVLHPPVLVSVFRVAHGMPVHTADGAISLVPMLPAILIITVIARAAAWLWRSLLAPDGAGSQRGPSPLAGVGALAAAYLVLATLVATSPTTGSEAVPLLQGWGALLRVVAIGVGLAVALHAVRPARPRLWLLMRAAATVVALVLAVSFALVLGNLLLSWSQFQEMSDALLASGAEPASRFDAAALGALQLAYLPNVVVWTASYLLGAGFAVGSGTIVSPFSVTMGTVPELPLATLLPDSALRWPWFPPALIALASVLAGAGIRSAGLAGRMRTRLVVGAVVALWAAVALAVLAAASGGALGEGRLGVVGPNPWVTMLWALLVIGLGQVAWALFPTVLADVLPVASNLMAWIRGVRLPRPRGRLRRRRARAGQRQRAASRGRSAGPRRRRRAHGATGSGTPRRGRRDTAHPTPEPAPEPSAAGQP